MKKSKDFGFTLIELLVVVAIISLLISILLPSLKCAKEKARTAKCGVQLKSIARGVQTYSTEFSSWFPGMNTSGVFTRSARTAEQLRRPDVPTQDGDWITPSLRFETDLGNTRAERIKTIVTDYACPSQGPLRIDFLYSQGLSSSPDREDFTDEIISKYAPISYLMPAHFQWWGQQTKNRVIGKSPAGRPLRPKVASTNFSAYHRGYYVSRIDQVGQTGRKILAADGMRYMLADGTIDFDPSPSPRWFGLFVSNGAWWCGSQAYGVKRGTSNWDGEIVGASSPDAQGRNLPWSYRHGCSGHNKVTEGVRDNDGLINAVFFDGHVSVLDDKQSRDISLWYPAGTKTKSSGSLNGLTSVPNDWEVP